VVRAVFALVLSSAVVVAATSTGVRLALDDPQPNRAGLTWAGRVFTSKEEFASFLYARGASYEKWAARHPGAAPWMEDYARPGAPSKPAPGGATAAGRPPATATATEPAGGVDGAWRLVFAALAVAIVLLLLAILRLLRRRRAAAAFAAEWPAFARQRGWSAPSPGARPLHAGSASASPFGRASARVAGALAASVFPARALALSLRRLAGLARRLVRRTLRIFHQLHRELVRWAEAVSSRREAAAHATESEPEAMVIDASAHASAATSVSAREAFGEATPRLESANGARLESEPAVAFGLIASGPVSVPRMSTVHAAALPEPADVRSELVTPITEPPPQSISLDPPSIEPPDSEAPSAAPSPTVVCEIALWRGYVKAQFYARICGDDSVSAIATSPTFRCRSAVPEETEQSVAALTALRDQLIGAGWEPNGRGAAWYARRFTSTVSA
jgi:hypothetical protein